MDAKDIIDRTEELTETARKAVENLRFVKSGMVKTLAWDFEDLLVPEYYDRAGGKLTVSVADAQDALLTGYDEMLQLVVKMSAAMDAMDGQIVEMAGYIVDLSDKIKDLEAK